MDEMFDLMTAAEVATEFGIDGSTVRRACINGWIPARKADGRTWLIKRPDAQARWGQAMLSRLDVAQIVTSAWEPSSDGKVVWLVLTTDLTGNRRFSPRGLPAIATPREKEKLQRQYAVGSRRPLGHLCSVPIGRSIYAAIEPGHNISIGVLNDGLWDICGPLVFAKYYNLTRNADLLTPEMGRAARAAALVFYESGAQRATEYLMASGVFTAVYDWLPHLAGPSLLDSAVWEPQR